MEKKQQESNELKSKKVPVIKNNKIYKIALSISMAILACVVQILANFGIVFDSKPIADLITIILGALVFFGLTPPLDKTDAENSESKENIKK